MAESRSTSIDVSRNISFQLTRSQAPPLAAFVLGFFLTLIVLTLSSGCTITSTPEATAQRVDVLSEVPAQSNQAVAPAAAAPYTLAPGDQIYINVFDEAGLTANARIAESGKLSFPLLGELSLAGLTVQEVQQLVEHKLRDGDYLVDPSVQVNVTEYRPFFINGGVTTPGAYPFQPGLTVDKAVAIAQGLSRQGAPVKYFLLRESDAQQQPIKVESDFVIRPGDVLTIRLGLF